MGGKNSAPAPPDYGPLIAANEKTAKFAQKLANEQWQWAKGVYNENKGLMKDTNTSFLKSMEMGRVAAEEDRARYKALYQPMEDRLIQEARTYDTQERRDMEAGAAQAGVAQQFDAARNQAASQLESFGVNPSATRFAALDLNMRAAEAAAKAGAGTAAARGVEDTARKLTAGAVDVGRGYPAAITASANQGVQAGGQAQLGTNQAYATGAEAMGTGPQWLGGSNTALANWGGALNNQYQNQIDQYKANQSASSGFGSTLGMLAGIGMKMYGFEEGGVVPPDMSPSRGAVDDDVPAAVSVGEVIVPSDVVNWLGEKHFNKLAEKARKEKSETRAVPTDSAGVRQYAQGGVVEPRLGSGPDIGPLPGGPVAGISDHARTPGFSDYTRPDSIPVFPTPGPPDIDRPYPLPGIIPAPRIPGPGPMPGPPIRQEPRWLPLPRGEYPTYPGHPRGPGWDGRGRGVRVPLPASTPHPWQDPKRVTLPAPTPHPWQDPRGVQTLIDPSRYPNQAVPVR